MEWALIPPRPRTAFWSICLATLPRGDEQARGGHLAPAVTERGTAGWELVVPGHAIDKAIGGAKLWWIDRQATYGQFDAPPGAGSTSL